MIRSAVLSECGNFRFQLVRQLERELWHEHLHPGTIGWVLNNPSTADAETDDATVRKCWKYTTDWGYGSMMFVNTNPFRATDPKVGRLAADVGFNDDILAANDSWLRYAQGQCPYLIAAWGDKAAPYLVRRAIGVLHPIGPLHAMRVTKAGNPQHPLYLPGDLQPHLWAPTKGLQ